MTHNLPKQPLTAPPTSRKEAFDLLAHLLNEQHHLEAPIPTAVEIFSEQQDVLTCPDQKTYYQDLLPIRNPDAGEQLAFQVDLHSCSGCKACVTACHSLNGLDDSESFRDVGLLLADNAGTGGTAGNTRLIQHVTTACHHCVDPGCLNACPVNAYEKDPITGIVRHLDDQCFGCQYCTLACPYDVPKYHTGKGIVRKCDMCSQRLSVGAAPACVQACPHGAISIQVVSQAEARQLANDDRFLSCSPDPRITVPTTRFVGHAARRTDLQPGTFESPRPGHPHWALIALLFLSQWAVGLNIAAMIPVSHDPGQDLSQSLLLLLGAVGLTLGSMFAGTFHLGRPQYAFRALLGVSHSWLSREVLAFGVYLPMIAGAAALDYWNQQYAGIAVFVSAVAGILAVTCSAMIYHITGRPFWSVQKTLPGFLIGGLGIALASWLALPPGNSIPNIQTLRPLIGITVSICFAIRLAPLLRALTAETTVTSQDQSIRAMAHTAVLLKGALRQQTTARLFLASIAISVGLVVGNDSEAAAQQWLLVAGAVAAALSELIDRCLFFEAVVPIRMPGVIR